MNASRASTIRLFGSPRLLTADGETIAGRAAQRHRLGLLALLALAPARSLGREKLQVYLWPEKDAESARLLLNQAVYTVRKALGDEALISEGDELRLDTGRVSVDVLDFERAAAAGEHERTVELQQAPFLDAFFISDAPEFERWSAGERNRLAGILDRSLEALAVAAEAKGDLARAVEWWKARAARNPHDSRVAVRLIEALEASGDRAGGLGHAAIHERLLREEFGIDAVPEVRAIAERLQHSPAPAAAFQHRDHVRATEPGEAGEIGKHAVPGEPAESAEPEEPTAVNSSRHARSRRMLPYLATAVVLGVVVAASVLARTTGAERGEGSVRLAGSPVSRSGLAILPLTNLSVEPGDAMLADAMTDELIAVLARSREMRVISSTSVFALRDRQLDVREAADSLGVSHILEGSVQRTGDRIRIRVRLVDADDASTLWSESYDREMSDVFAIQDDVARSVSQVLGSRIGVSGDVAAPRRLPTTSVLAYELYLRGTDRVVLRSDSTAREALALLQRAVQLDSTYASAWAGMARLHVRVGPTDPTQLKLALDAARRAVALDDSLAEAHASLGVALHASGQADAAEQHMLRAIELEPGRAMWREWIVHVYLRKLQPDRALAHARRAVDLDPLSPYARSEVARALAAAGRCDEALPILEELSGLRPPMLRVAPLLARCYAVTRRWNDAIRVTRANAEGGDHRARATMAYALAHTGARDEALEIRRAMVAAWEKDDGTAYSIAIAEAGLGNHVEAVGWLARAASEPRRVPRGDVPDDADTDPLLAAVRAHPAYARLPSGGRNQNR